MSREIKFTKEEKEFISQHLGKISMKNIAIHLKVSYSKVYTFINGHSPKEETKDGVFKVELLTSEHTWLI